MPKIEVKKPIKDNDPRIKCLNNDGRKVVLISTGVYDCEISRRVPGDSSGGMTILFGGNFQKESLGRFNGSRMENFSSPIRPKGLEFYLNSKDFAEYFSEVKYT